MKRSRSGTTVRLSRDSERLIALALDLNASASRTEDRFWESQLQQQLEKMMGLRSENAMEAALDHLFQTNPGAYDVLIDAVEFQSESLELEHDGQRWEGLLLAAPIAAWTRYQIPCGPLRPELAESLAQDWKTLVLASEARFAMSPYLYSLDQLPRNFAETHAMTQKLMQAALAQQEPRFNFDAVPESAQLLADTRFLMAVAAVPKGQALFQWQEAARDGRDPRGTPHPSRTSCLEQWIAAAKPKLAPVLPGCGFELLLPDAYYVSCREADRVVRPYSIKAAVGFLENQLRLAPAELRAVVAGVGEQRIDEYRISLTKRNDPDVIYGIVWQLFGREDENAEPGPVDEIVSLLKATGVQDIRRLPGVLAPEFCDDCGAPYFPNPSAEMVHAELPDEADEQPAHFH